MAILLCVRSCRVSGLYLARAVAARSCHQTERGAVRRSEARAQWGVMAGCGRGVPAGSRAGGADRSCRRDTAARRSRSDAGAAPARWRRSAGRRVGARRRRGGIGRGQAGAAGGGGRAGRSSGCGRSGRAGRGAGSGGDEFESGQPHRLPAPAVSPVLVAEEHIVGFEADETLVGDRDVVRVAAQVAEDGSGAGEGRLDVDHPVLVPYRTLSSCIPPQPSLWTGRAQPPL